MLSNELIQAFLNVVEYGNITAAATNTFTTQSYVSKQIQALEEEVGTKLLIRNRGRSEISLTPAGHEFLETARQWQNVMKGFEDISEHESMTEVSIGALDRLNHFTLREAYRTILRENMNIRLDCHTRHSREIYSMMENRQLDIGIVSVLYPTKNISASLLNVENMIILSHPESGYKEVVTPEELLPQQEIYSGWSTEFEIWHNQLWPGRQYRMHVGTSATAPAYLNEPGRWYIAPDTIVENLENKHSFSVHRLSVDIPKQRLYLLEQKQPRQSREKAIEIVKGHIKEAFSKL